jgi:hypothetical protein
VRPGCLVLPLALAAALFASCRQKSSSAPQGAEPLEVTGTYDFSGGPGFFLRGSIAFEHPGDTVRVTETVYLNSPDRALVGEGTLVGDRLDIALVPENGDTDFQADCTFVFSDGGDRFDVGFSDTNGDAGPIGAYRGTRR